MQLTRDPRAEDYLYVRKTWLEAYRDSSVGRGLGVPHYDRLWSRLIDRILRRARVLLVFDSLEPEVVLGFLVWEPSRPNTTDLIHFAYVRYQLRRMKLGQKLLQDAGLLSPARSIRCSHWTLDAQRETAKWQPRPVYDIGWAVGDPPPGDTDGQKG